MKDVVEKEVINFDEIICERVEENINLFNKEEIDIIINNKNLAEKLYLLGTLDYKFAN